MRGLRLTREEYERLRRRSSKPAPKASKYGNVRTVASDGVVFASAREARRWEDLRLLERSGEVLLLRRQVRYPIVVNNVLICTYISDFDYNTRAGGHIVEDVKGHKTEVY